MHAPPRRATGTRRCRRAPPRGRRSCAAPRPAPACRSSRRARASTAPMTPPTTSAAPSSRARRGRRERSPGGSTHATGGHHHREHHADDAERLPRRAVSCFESPRRLRMNSTPATRYATVDDASCVSTALAGALAPEHPQHALRDEEAAGDVDRGDQHGERAEHATRRRASPPICSMPPMTMMPLIALVTLISGVCSAGVTFQMTCQPTKQASTKTVKCWRNSRRREAAERRRARR